jgi:hypothetical protein
MMLVIAFNTEYFVVIRAFQPMKLRIPEFLQYRVSCTRMLEVTCSPFRQLLVKDPLWSGMRTLYDSSITSNVKDSLRDVLS